MKNRHFRVAALDAGIQIIIQIQKYMKSIHFQFILFCSCLIALTYSCEKAEIQKSVPNDSEKITQRLVDECDDCPNMDDCCCQISWVSGEQLEIDICGSTDGDVASCSDDLGTCSTIDGRKSSTFILNMNNPRELFCMMENRGFRIKYYGSGTANGNVSCQYGQLAPQSINFQFNGPGTKAFSTDGECELEQCFP
jgi:hypothetical protein